MTVEGEKKKPSNNGWLAFAHGSTRSLISVVPVLALGAALVVRELALEHAREVAGAAAPQALRHLRRARLLACAGRRRRGGGQRLSLRALCALCALYVRLCRLQICVN